MRSLVKHMLITITISTVDVFKNFKLLSCVRVTLERVKKYLMSTVFLKMEPILFPLTTWVCVHYVCKTFAIKLMFFLKNIERSLVGIQQWMSWGRVSAGMTWLNNEQEEYATAWESREEHCWRMQQKVWIWLSWEQHSIIVLLGKYCNNQKIRSKAQIYMLVTFIIAA